MTSVAIRTGVTSATPASECPPDELADLLWMRRKFCSSVLPRDCRLLLFFIEDGRNSGDFLGFGTEEAYLRDGLGLSDAEAVRWAVDGLRQLNQEVPIAWKEAVEVGSKRDRMEQERKQIEAVQAANPKASVRQIADAVGLPKSTVQDRVSEKSSIDEKSDKPSRSQRTASRQIYLPLDPKAAADRLVQKFGVEFVKDLVERAREVLR